MLKINNEIIKQQPNFWSNFMFHPTDAIEDPWGKRILDTIAEDKSIDTVRMYPMFEDIMYDDGNGGYKYDFRVNDLRLDYMIEKGFNIMLCYAYIPPCIASDPEAVSSNAKVSTRYKGKMINTSTPIDYKLWEELCYQYTKHIVERYGEERVSKWYLQCFNEPDNNHYFMGNIAKINPQGDKTRDEWAIENNAIRATEYCKLYQGFHDGIRRVSKNLIMGGPVMCGANLAYIFLDKFLSYVKEKNLQFDYLSLHAYGANVNQLSAGEQKLCIENQKAKLKYYFDVIEKQGFQDTDIILDEWGACNIGFKNVEEYPPLIFREKEVYSAYLTKMIHDFIEEGYPIKKMLICLSGQHDMTEDFSGFRNFFTLNFIRKPIYNAFCLAARLHTGLLSYETENQNIFAVPTKDENGNLAVMLTYCDEYFEENIPEIDETVDLGDTADGRKVTVWCIDKDTTNPYRLAQKNGIGKNPTKEEIALLREEGKLKPVAEFVYNNNDKFTLKLTANCTYMLTAE